MTPCIILVNGLSSLLSMVMAMNSLVWRGRALVDPREGETAFLETIRATNRGGMAHAGYFAFALMDTEVE